MRLLSSSLVALNAVPAVVGVISHAALKRRLEIKSHRSEFNRPLRVRHPLLGQRKLDTPCDAAFLSCLPDEGCLSCFEQLGAQDINWAGVQSATPCADVVQMLNDAGHCEELGDGTKSRNLFCDTFNSCVMWDDFDDFDDDDFDAIGVDCDSLKKCEWDGMHENFLGDGICQRYGCYNHKICHYDQGDCCEDTCTSSAYADCGVDGYQCKDPASPNCQSYLNDECKAPETLPPKPAPVCDSPEKLYTIREYDSWGDGWDQTELKISDAAGKEVFSGKLQNGFEGIESVCLQKGCYSASASGGIWGVEVSWDVRPVGGGAVLASGGSPMDCTFPIGGSECDNTCNGKPSDPGEKFISECINNKCVLQLGACNTDPDGCASCLEADSPTFCFTNDAYNALVDCAICQCMDEPPSYCDTMKPSDSKSNTCSAKDVLQGSAAVISFSNCSNMDGVDAMVNEWNNDMFGTLDDFEACSHTYNDAPGKSSKTALDCMDMLYEIVNGETDDPAYVVALAKNIYENSESMCDCASQTNKVTPSCQAFFRFKTYLYESLDACTALDEIDCASWEDFARPCKKNMEEKFTTIDFKQEEQCQFIHEEQCGGVGAFPAFRRLDCGKEISKVAWDFYNDFSRSCLGDNPEPAPQPAPVAPAPIPAPLVPAVPVPVPSSDSAPIPKTPTKEYVPPKGRDPLEPNVSTKKWHPFRWLVFFSAVGACGYVVYKRRHPSFDFVRYHRQSEWEDDGLDTELFSSNDTGSFEPPSVTVSRGMS